MKSSFRFFAFSPTNPEMDYGGTAEYLHLAASQAEPLRHGGKGPCYALTEAEMKKKGETFIAEDFELSPTTRTWIEKKYPQVDVEKTVEKFRRKAEAEGWMYRNWQRGFEGIVEKGMENGWRTIVTIKGGVQFDPKWIPLLKETRAAGFREPEKHETPQIYRTAFDQWKRQPKTNVVNFGGVLKKVM